MITSKAKVVGGYLLGNSIVVSSDDDSITTNLNNRAQLISDYYSKLTSSGKHYTTMKHGDVWRKLIK